MSETSINVSGDMEVPLRPAGGENRYSWDIQKYVRMTDRFDYSIKINNRLNCILFYILVYLLYQTCLHQWS